MNIALLNELEVRLVGSYAKEPLRAHPTDAGLDLAAREEVLLDVRKRVLVSTGVQVRIPKGYVGLLVPRSSLSKNNIILTNSCGVIDSDYRGELLVSLMYLGNPETGIGIEDHRHISRGERIAQLLVVPIALPEVKVVYEDDEDWNNTERGTGGFGSTGK